MATEVVARSYGNVKLLRSEKDGNELVQSSSLANLTSLVQLKPKVKSYGILSKDMAQ